MFARIIGSAFDFELDAFAREMRQRRAGGRVRRQISTGEHFSRGDFGGASGIGEIEV
jgi:hypothetical protein